MRRSSRSRCRPMRRGRALDEPMEPFERLAAQGARIERLTSDSRRSTAESAFVAYPGEKADGRAYIADAARRGAAAALWEAEDFGWQADWVVRYVAVEGLENCAGSPAP